jgi:hypothetical protein
MFAECVSGSQGVKLDPRYGHVMCAVFLYLTAFPFGVLLQIFMRQILDIFAKAEMQTVQFLTG